MKRILVIPVLNEGDRIRSLLKGSMNYVDQIIVVDDGSSESKKAIADGISQKVIVLRHRINLGKGAAMKTGCEAAIRLGADIIILMDGDGQHKPEDIPRFVDELVGKNVEIVFGSRKIGRDMPLVMMLGNKFLSLATSLLFRIYVSDTQSGFRAFKSKIYPLITWNSSRYSVETEMIVNVGKNKLKFSEINIETIYKDDYKGTTVFDGLKIFFNMIIWRIL